jgi:hypothetical protein
MKIQLSQRERMLLEDEKGQEEICIIKYNFIQTNPPQTTSVSGFLETQPHILYN